MTAAQVIEAPRINPFIGKAAKLRRLCIEQLDVEIQKLRPGGQFRRQSICKVFLTADGGPKRIQVRLRVNLEAVLVHATVQVHGKLRNTEQLFATDQFCT